MRLSMKSIAKLIVPLVLLSACGEGPDEDLLNAPLRIVDIPEYPTVALPGGLVWETNEDDPLFASSEAIRGGTLRVWILSFPLTLRLVGPDSNGAFAGYMRSGHLGLVDFHPNTLNPTPSLATHWAFDPDGKTVYYRLNPNARWSDGVPVTADDFVFTRDFMRSMHIVAPWYNNHFTSYITDVRKHDAHTISVVGATAKPRDELLAEYGIRPTPRHFHRLDGDWVASYNWEIEPNTGPYQISRIEKGKYIEFKRKDDWWGDEVVYYAHRFNADKVRVTVIRDVNVAWEYFLRGELDTFGLVLPQFWHEKAKGEQFDKGYIRRVKFYTDTPLPASGMWLNLDDPVLADERVRYALAHATNIGKVIRTVLRNDYERLQTHHEGYGPYSNREIRAREFDLDKANAYLEAAGWTGRDRDGIRMKGEQRLALRVVYGAPHHTDRLVILREEAKKAGIELNLQLMDSASSFKQIQEKKHQIGWMSWAGGGFAPRYWQFYHSDNAHKTQTNNIVNFDDPEMDRLITQYREATEKQSRIELALRLEQMVHDSGALIPTFKVPYTREGFWRWMRLPEHLGTRTSGALFSGFDSSAGGLFWIDEDLKRKTLEARKAGESFAPEYLEDTTWKVD